MPRVAEPIILPRALIFLASIWLIGSWIATIGFVPPVHPSSSSYEPGVRLMLVALACGLLVAWPMLRLSQTAAVAPLRQVLLDVVVLAAMVQVVLWPLRLVTRWSLGRTVLIDGTLLAWLMLVAAVVAPAIARHRGGARTFAMVACLLLVLGGPALGLLTGAAAPALAGPFVALRDLSIGGGAPVEPAHRLGFLLAAAAALIAWALAAFALRRGHGTRPT